jgi:uncharacterized protein YjeT (DUF2065 family)
MIDPNDPAIESHPIGILIVSIVLLTMGIIFIAFPSKWQRIAQRSYVRNPVVRHWPFADFALASYYVPGLRVMGIAFVVIGVLCFILWLLSLRATGPI